MPCAFHRLEQRIAEAQRRDVLHRLLAEIVIDPESALFRKGLGDDVVDDAAGGESTRQPDPDIVAGQPRRFRPLIVGPNSEARSTGDGEPARCRPAFSASVPSEAVGLRGIEPLVEEPLEAADSAVIPCGRREQEMFEGLLPSRRGTRRIVMIRERAVPVMVEPSGSSPSACRPRRGSSIRWERSPVAPEQKQFPRGLSHACLSIVVSARETPTRRKDQGRWQRVTRGNR